MFKLNVLQRFCLLGKVFVLQFCVNTVFQGGKKRKSCLWNHFFFAAFTTPFTHLTPTETSSPSFAFQQSVGVGADQPEDDKALGRPRSSLLVPEGGYRKDGEGIFLQGLAVIG